MKDKFQKSRKTPPNNSGYWQGGVVYCFILLSENNKPRRIIKRRVRARASNAPVNAKASVLARPFAEIKGPDQDKKPERAKAKKKSSNIITNSTANVSFEAVASAWAQEYQERVRAETHAHAVAWLKKYVFPLLGKQPITKIEAPEILETLKQVEASGARNTAHRIRGVIGQVFRYGIRNGMCKHNPTSDLRDAILPAAQKHFASITDPNRVGGLLRAIDLFSGTYPVKCALQLAPLLFVRPGELRKAEWQQFDLEKGEWRYTVSKTNTDHLVPLAAQAVDILRNLHQLTGNGRHVFPGARGNGRPMSHATLNAALRRLGYDTRTDITGHGFRAMARTILHEELEQKPEVIEHQLAHAVPGALGRAYNRTRFIKERRAMMQLWADYLDQLKNLEKG